MPSRARETFNRSAEFLEDNTLAQLVLTSLGAVVITITDGVNTFINTVVAFWTDPVGTFTEMASSLIESIVGGAAFITETGAFTTAEAVAMTSIFGFPLGILFGITIAAYLLAKTVKIEETSDTVFGLFSGIDWPGIGADEDED